MGGLYNFYAPLNFYLVSKNLDIIIIWVYKNKKTFSLIRFLCYISEMFD